MWGNIMLTPELNEWWKKRRHQRYRSSSFGDDERDPSMLYLMEEGVKYRVFLNPRSEYLSLTNMDVKAQLSSIQEANEQ